MEITIEVPWSREHHTNAQWDDLCAWTIETYGLPGSRFMWHPRYDAMDFVFTDENDALMFQLKTGCARRNTKIVDLPHPDRIRLDASGNVGIGTVK